LTYKVDMVFWDTNSILDTDQVALAYKDLWRVERAFREIKSCGLFFMRVNACYYNPVTRPIPSLSLIPTPIKNALRLACVIASLNAAF